MNDKISNVTKHNHFMGETYGPVYTRDYGQEMRP